MISSNDFVTAMIGVQTVILCGMMYHVHQLWEDKEKLDAEKAWKIYKLKAIVYGGWALGSPTTPSSEWNIIYLINMRQYEELNLTSSQINDRKSTFFKPRDGDLTWDENKKKAVPCTAEHLSPDDASPDKYRWCPALQTLILKADADKDIKKDWAKADKAARKLKSMGISVYLSGEVVEVED